MNFQSNNLRQLYLTTNYQKMNFGQKIDVKKNWRQSFYVKLFTITVKKYIYVNKFMSKTIDVEVFAIAVKNASLSNKFGLNFN